MKYIAIVFLIISLISCNDKSASKQKIIKLENIEKNIVHEEFVQDFEKNFIGTLNNKIKVVFHLKNVNGELNGFYFYENKGIDIKLKGNISNNIIIIDELDNLNNKVAILRGKINSQSIIGEWASLKTNKSLKLNLVETNKLIPSLPNNIEGTYKIKNEDETEKCILAIEVTKKNGDYFYNFKSDSRNLNGKITFMRSLEEKEIYITFEGIKWAEYSGDVSNEDAEEQDLDLPLGIDGLFTENEILIQNYGNAMNYYVKLSDCGKKYIRLIK